MAYNKYIVFDRPLSTIKLITIIVNTLDMILIYLYFYDFYISKSPKYKLSIFHYVSINNNKI